VQLAHARPQAAITIEHVIFAEGNYYVDPEAKLALVIRIRGINGVSPKVRSVTVAQTHSLMYADAIFLLRLAH
jgi:hypothetical protein